MGEEALRSAEVRYRTLVEQLPLATYIDRVDPSSSNIYSSPQLESMLGYSADEWVSDPLLFVELLHPDDRERVLAAHARMHATSEALHVEYRLKARDGRWVWVQDEARVVEDGTEPVVQGYLLDVTARREAEEQLRHQAFHDPLTDSRTEPCLRTASTTLSSSELTSTVRPPCCSSTSTTSRLSTTVSVISPGTRSCAPSECVCGHRCPRVSRWREWVATSSPFSSRSPTAQVLRSMPRSASRPHFSGRSTSMVERSCHSERRDRGR